MEMGASYTNEAAQLAEEADVAGSNMRIFYVDKAEEDARPAEDIKPFYQWTVASSETVVGPINTANNTDGFDGLFSAVCWSFGYGVWKTNPDVPVGLIDSHWGGTNIEAWSSPDTLAKCSSSTVIGVDDPNSNPSSLYNGMIYPLKSLQIAGAVWYQGEANVADLAPEHYECVLENMIQGWRGDFGWDFPFGIVMLAGWGRVGISCASETCTPDDSYPVADMRAAELHVSLSTPNAFLAVAVDYEDPDPINNPATDIHPLSKRAVGVRLADGYRGRETPSLSNCEVKNDELRISLRGVPSSAQLAAKSKDGVEVQIDGKWVPAAITGAEGSEIAVAVSSNSAIDAVRYAWRDSPCCDQNAYDRSDCKLGGGWLCTLYVGEDGEELDVPVAPFYAKIEEGVCKFRNSNLK
jgi:sialate O-acetylesterase